MNYAITKLQKCVLHCVARKIVRQSFDHKNNIITYYKIIADVAKKEFTEESKQSLNSFLIECHKCSLGN